MPMPILLPLAALTLGGGAAYYWYSNQAEGGGAPPSGGGEDDEVVVKVPPRSKDLWGTDTNQDGVIDDRDRADYAAQTGRIVLGNLSMADVRQAKRAATVAKNEAAQARAEAREAAAEAREEHAAVREQKARGKRVSFQVEEALSQEDLELAQRGEDFAPDNIDGEGDVEVQSGRIFLGAIKRRK